jgi:hypothetical protein
VSLRGISTSSTCTHSNQLSFCLQPNTPETQIYLPHLHLLLLLTAEHAFS